MTHVQSHPRKFVQTRKISKLRRPSSKQETKGRGSPVSFWASLSGGTGGDERRRREGLVGKGGEKGENKVEKGNKQEAREAAD